MKTSVTISSTQTTPSIIPLEIYRSCYVKNIAVKVPSTTNPVAFALAIVDDTGDPIFFTTGIYPDGTNVVKAETVVHRGYSLWLKPETATGNDIIVTFVLDIVPEFWE